MPGEENGICYRCPGISHFLKRNGFPASRRTIGGPGAGHRPTIGLSESGRSRAVAGRPGGNLATWKPELSRVCAAATAERAAHCDRNASTVPLEVSVGKRGRRIALGLQT